MKAKFFLIAFSETHCWAELPAGCTGAFGVYLVCEGEGTHICSMTPSSRADFMENVFVGLDYHAQDAETQQWIDENRFNDGGESTTYFGFIDRDLNLSRCSELREFESDEEDPEKARDDLWEQARESFQANDAGIPCLEA